MITKLIKLSIFIFVVVNYIKYSTPLYQNLKGVYGFVFFGVSIFVFFALALKMFNGAEKWEFEEVD